CGHRRRGRVPAGAPRARLLRPRWIIRIAGEGERRARRRVLVGCLARVLERTLFDAAHSALRVTYVVAKDCHRHEALEPQQHRTNRDKADSDYGLVDEDSEEQEDEPES